MHQVEMSLEEAIEVAKKRVLPAGFKPEDYFCFGIEFSLRVAKMVLKEANHIIYLDKKYGNKNNIL